MKKDNQYNYISLQEASKFCSYSQEYLSLRARQKKLKAVKIARNWVTTKQWVEEYLKNVEEYNNNLNNFKNNKKKISPPGNLPIESAPVFRFGFVMALVFALATTGLVWGKDSFQSVYDELTPYAWEVSQTTDLIVRESIDSFKQVAGDLNQTKVFIAGLGANAVQPVKEPPFLTFQELKEFALSDLKGYSQWMKEIIQSLPRNIARWFGSQAREFSQNYLEANDFVGKEITKLPEKAFQGLNNLGKGYLTANDFVEKEFKNYAFQISVFGQQFKKGSQELVETVKRIPHLVSQPFKEKKEKIVKEEEPSLKEIDDLQKQIAELKEKGLTVKEIEKIVEVSKVVQIQPVKEITKETIVTKVEEKELKAIKAQLSLWGGEIDDLKAQTQELRYTPYSPGIQYVSPQVVNINSSPTLASLGVSGDTSLTGLTASGPTTLGTAAADTLTIKATSTFEELVTAQAGLTVGTSTLEIDEQGNLTTTGNITTTGSGGLVIAGTFTPNQITAFTLTGDITGLSSPSISGIGTVSASNLSGVAMLGDLNLDSHNITNVNTLNTGQGDYELYAMNQNVLTGSSPTFAGLTVGSLAGYIKGTAGVLSGQTGVPYTDLTYSGLTASHYLRASGTTAASFSAIQDADLPSTIVRTSRTISTTLPLAGGGDLSANRTLSLNYAAPLSLDASNNLYIAAGAVANSMLANSSLTVSAGSGLTDGGSVSLGGTVSLNVGAGTGISVAANAVSATLGTAVEKNELSNSGTLGFAWADDELANDLTLAGATVGTSALTLVQSTSPSPTAEGRIEWDTDDDQIVVGDSSGQKTFYAGDQALLTGSSPTFAGLTVGSLAGYIKGTAGLLSGQTGVPYTDLTYSGLTIGHYLRASGTTAASFSAIQASDLPTGIDAAKIADGSVSNTEFQYLNEVSSAIQTQINTKAADSVVLKKDGSVALTADWDIGDGRMIQADKIRARDGAGLSLFEDGGTGIFIEDGGDVGIGTTGPDAKLDILDISGAQMRLTYTNESVFTDFTLDTNGNLEINPAKNVYLKHSANTGANLWVCEGTACPGADTSMGSTGGNLVVEGGIYGGTRCPADMVYVPGDRPFCIDKYEAYNSGGTVVNDTCTNGSQAEVDANTTTAIAGSASGQTPLVSLNWCAAKKACQNAGKHLCTNIEWFQSCNYKGGQFNITAEQQTETMACNTEVSAPDPHLTGASATCVTQEGAYDMIGNVWEWVDKVVTTDPTNGLASNYVTGYDFATGLPTSVGASSNAYGNDYYWAYNGAGAARAARRGGSWDDGANDGCFALWLYDAPSLTYTDIGFRCCR